MERVDIVIGALRFRIAHLEKLGISDRQFDGDLLDFKFNPKDNYLRYHERRWLEKAIKELEATK